MSLLLLLALAAHEATPGERYACLLRETLDSGILSASQTVTLDGQPQAMQINWSESGLPAAARDLPPGRNAAFLSVTWTATAPPRDPAALRASLQDATIRIWILTPTRLHARPLLRIYREPRDLLGMTLGGLAEVGGRYPWATVDVKWRDLSAFSGPGPTPYYILERYEGSPNRYRGPIRQGPLAINRIVRFMAAVPGLLGRLADQRQQRDSACRRETVPVAAPDPAADI